MKNILSAILLSISVWVLAGCQNTFNNFTPARLPQNASGLYTFSFAANVSNANMVKDTERAWLVINGEKIEMDRVDPKNRIFSIDYRLPPGVTEMRYYYELTYDYTNNGIRGTAQKNSYHDAKGIFQTRLVNRYAIQLVTDRGPAGSTIALVGNGFSPTDVILVGTVESETRILSPNSIEFVIPALPAGITYDVMLRTAEGDIGVGNLRIDQAKLTVQPTRLVIDSGDADILVLEIGTPAPQGGLLVDVRTDIPASIIMPEAVIPAGARSVNITVEGGEPGTGVIVAEIPGFNTVEIPVEVR